MNWTAITIVTLVVLFGTTTVVFLQPKKTTDEVALLQEEVEEISSSWRKVETLEGLKALGKTIQIITIVPVAVKDNNRSSTGYFLVEVGERRVGP